MSANREQYAPYIEGAQFTIRPHLPYFIGRAAYAMEGVPEDEEDMHLTREQLSFKYPMPSGFTIEQQSAEIVITEEIKVGPELGAQIVEVNRSMIAKIYDPFCYPGSDEHPRKPFLDAATAFLAESEAYQRLLPFWGTCVPEYYDSWILDWDLGGGKVRSVRLILLERLRGDLMEDFYDWNPSRWARSRIMEEIVRTLCHLLAAGLNHVDVHPRHVIICGNVHGESLRVVHLDFVNLHAEDPGTCHQSREGRPTDAEKELSLPDLCYEPFNPALIFHEERIQTGFRERFGNWIDWSWQEWLDGRWMTNTLFPTLTVEERRKWDLGERARKIREYMQRNRPEDLELWEKTRPDLQRTHMGYW